MKAKLIRKLGERLPPGLRAAVALDKRECARYEALLLPGKKVTSVFYVFRDKVWGFGLMKPDASPCL